MALRNAMFLENAGAVYNAREYRALLDALFNRTPGVFGAADLLVTEQDTPGIGVKVAAGSGLVAATGAGISGLYFVDNDADEEVALDPPDATNDRFDIVGVRIRDTESAGGDDDETLLVVTGTPDPSPVDPTLPDNFLALARVSVEALTPSIVNADLTDLRATDGQQLVSAAGGTIICTSSTRPPSGERFVGMRIFETDTLRELLWVGAGWKLSISSTTSGTWGSAVDAETGAISFGVTFLATPSVRGTVLIGSNRDVVLNWQSISTTGVNYRLHQDQGNTFSGTAYTIHWEATGLVA